MKEKRRRPGTCQRGGDLLPDQTGLTHSRHNDFPFTLVEQIHGLRKSAIEPLNEGLNGTRFDI